MTTNFLTFILHLVLLTKLKKNKSLLLTILILFAYPITVFFFFWISPTTVVSTHCTGKEFAPLPDVKVYVTYNDISFEENPVKHVLKRLLYLDCLYSSYTTNHAGIAYIKNPADVRKISYFKTGYEQIEASEYCERALFRPSLKKFEIFANQTKIHSGDSVKFSFLLFGHDGPLVTYKHEGVLKFWDSLKSVADKKEGLAADTVFERKAVNFLGVGYANAEFEKLDHSVIKAEKLRFYVYKKIPDKSTPLIAIPPLEFPTSEHLASFLFKLAPDSKIVFRINGVGIEFGGVCEDKILLSSADAGFGNADQPQTTVDIPFDTKIKSDIEFSMCDSEVGKISVKMLFYIYYGGNRNPEKIDPVAFTITSPNFIRKNKFEVSICSIDNNGSISRDSSIQEVIYF